MVACHNPDSPDLICLLRRSEPAFMAIAALEFISIDSSDIEEMSKQSLTIKDDRTGKSYTLPIESGTVRAMDLRQIKTDTDDFGLMTYDPALMNTASTKSAITFIDGNKGILEYRGYPVEQLAEKTNFLEIAYL